MSTTTNICVGFKAHMGWVNAVGVNQGARKLLPLFAHRVDLINSEEREVLEPYHVAGGIHGLGRVSRPNDPEAIIARGRQQQVKDAEKQLRLFHRELAKEGLAWTSSVVLTGRGKMGDLDRVLASHALIHVAEGEAIRDATRAALDALAIPWHNRDEKTVLEAASKRLKCGANEVGVMVKSLKPQAATTWGKEERVIALAAWLPSSG